MPSAVDLPLASGASAERATGSIFGSGWSWCRWALSALPPDRGFSRPLHRSAHIVSRVLLRSLRARRQIRPARLVFAEHGGMEGSRDAAPRGPVVLISPREFAGAVGVSGQGMPTGSRVQCQLLRQVTQTHKASRVYRILWSTADGKGASLILKRILAGRDEPHPEVDVNTSGLLTRLPNGLSAPRCFSACTGDAGYDLWLEDLTRTTRPVRRRAEDLRAAAAALGQLNGERWDGGRGRRPNLTIARADQWAAVYRWRDALAAGCQWRRRLERVASQADRLLRTFSTLDMVFCHQDASPFNLRITLGSPSRVAALDWELCGPAPWGQELVPLVWARWQEARSDEIRSAEACAWQGYLDGLRAGGASVAPRHLQAMTFAYSASVFIRYATHVAAIGDRGTLELILRHGEQAASMMSA